MKDKLLNFLLRLIESRIRLWSSGTPWDYVQSQTNGNVHKWLNIGRSDVKLWVIVGGYIGDELNDILLNFPNCRVDVFEPSPKYFSHLQNRFSKEPRVKTRKLAISNKSGKAVFFETTLEGSGSLLALGSHKSLFGSEQADSFEVDVSTLELEYGESSIDVLQIDVQGAENLVIQGAAGVLDRTRAILVEVSMVNDLYVGGTNWSDLRSQLENAGFLPVLIGMDTNLTGNALFVRPPKSA